MSTPGPDAQAEESFTSTPPRVIERSFVVYVQRSDGTPDVCERLDDYAGDVEVAKFEVDVENVK